MKEEKPLDARYRAVYQRLDVLLRRVEGWSARQRALATEALSELELATREVCEHHEKLAQAYELLHSEHQLYWDLFDLAPDGYLLTDGANAIQKINRVAASLLNAPPDSLIGRSLAAFVADDEREGLQSRLAQLQSKRVDRVTDWELWIKPQKGLPFCAAVSVVGMLDSRGRLVGLRWLLRDVTRRKWDEEALQRSERLYRTIADNIQDGLTIIEDGKTVYANSRACEIFGYPESEYVKMTGLDLAAPEEKERIKRIVDEIRRTGGIPDELEYWIVRKDGSRCCICNRYTSIHKEGNSVSRLLVTTDITERKRAEEALRRRAAQLALLNDIGGKIVAELELDKVLKRAAQLVQRSFGYHHVALFTIDRERGELVMRARAGSFAHLYPLDHRLSLGQGMVGWVSQHGKRLLANDVRTEPHYVNLYPGVITTKSELSVPIRVGKEVVGVFDVQSPQLNAFDENDAIVMETLTDQIAAAIENARLYETLREGLLERERVEEALRESEMRHRIVSDLTSDFAFAVRVEEDGTFVPEWVTGAFVRITGFTVDEVQVRGGWRTLVHPDDIPIILQHLETYLVDQSGMAEFRAITKDGEVRWLRSYGRSMWDEAHDRVVRIYGAARDITEHKRAEQYVLGTEYLTAMGHMAAAMTQEIKTPLQEIHGRLEKALSSGTLRAECKEHLRSCRDEVEHLTEITERVLGLAQPMGDGLDTTSLVSLVERALKLVDKPLRQADIQVVTDLPEDLPPVLVSPDRIVQVLLNLIMNAIEAVPDGGSVHITAGADESMVALVLTNNGPPIPVEHLTRIFDPFFTTKSGGAGLGLFISRKIIEQHGGKMTVENLSDGRGVSVVATLPAALSEAE